MTIFRERDRRVEDRKRRSRGGGRGETKVEIRPPSVGRGGEVVVSMMERAKMKGLEGRGKSATVEVRQGKNIFMNILEKMGVKVLPFREGLDFKDIYV